MEKRIIAVGLIVGIAVGFVAGSTSWHSLMDLPIIHGWQIEQRN